MKFFYDGKNTWPDRGLETEQYNEFRRRGKASEKYGEINHQNWICKWILRCFLLVISISFVIFLLGDANTALGILFILAIKSPLAAGCLYIVIKNKKLKTKLELHLSDNSLTALYDWDHVKCKQCGGNDLAEIKSDVDGLEEQIRMREVVLRLPHHRNAALQCNGCENWGHDRKKLESNLERRYNGEYIIEHCPKCNGTDHENLIVHSGCCQPPTPFPNKRCNDCGRQWYSRIFYVNGPYDRDEVR